MGSQSIRHASWRDESKNQLRDDHKDDPMIVSAVSRRKYLMPSGRPDRKPSRMRVTRRARHLQGQPAPRRDQTAPPCCRRSGQFLYPADLLPPKNWGQSVALHPTRAAPACPGSPLARPPPARPVAKQWRTWDRCPSPEAVDESDRINCPEPAVIPGAARPCDRPRGSRPPRSPPEQVGVQG